MNQTTTNGIIATGRRKTSVARVRVVQGTGKVIVNDKDVNVYFNGLERHQRDAVRPLGLFSSSKAYDYIVIANGGGITGQAGAISLGIARALLKLEPNLKASLRKEGLLTRDPRMVERKKSGQPKARKRFQFSKR